MKKFTKNSHFDLTFFKNIIYFHWVMLFFGEKTMKTQTHCTIERLDQCVSQKESQRWSSGFKNIPKYSSWKYYEYEIRIGETGLVYVGKESLQQTDLYLKSDVAKRIRSYDDADLRNKVVAILIKRGYIQL